MIEFHGGRASSSAVTTMASAANTNAKSCHCSGEAPWIIPAEIATAALIPLGYPLGKFGRPPRRPLTEVAHADRWARVLNPV